MKSKRTAEYVNYNVFYEYMKAYAEINEIEYYDFILCRIDLLDMENADFLDFHYLSGQGAVKYSMVFADVMTSYDEAHSESVHLMNRGMKTN